MQHVCFWYHTMGNTIIIKYSGYVSNDDIRIIESKRFRWAGHMACMGTGRNAFTDLLWETIYRDTEIKMGR